MAWSAVLTVNRDGSVDVSEKFEVTATKPRKGFSRGLGVDTQYNTLAISNVSCPQGEAGLVGNDFVFGYKNDQPPGLHIYTLNYRAVGMVVPAGQGARLQWRALNERYPIIKEIKVVLPAGTAPVKASAIVMKTETGRILEADEELPCTIAGNVVTVPVRRSVVYTVDISVDIPAGVIDNTAMRAGLEKVLDSKFPPTIKEYRAVVRLNEDRTMERTDSYLPAPDNKVQKTLMDYQKLFNTTYIKDKKDPMSGADFVYNNLYLYGFDKKSCDSDNYTHYNVCIPVENSGKNDVSYSMWGNFNNREPLFFDLDLPPAKVKMTGRVLFDITLPPFVKKEEVKMKLYLIKGFYGTKLTLRQAPFESKWEGNTLKVEFIGSLVDEQFLLARIFLPSAGFVEPGTAKRMWIKLSNFWLFERLTFLAVLAFIVLVLAGIVGLIMYKMKKIAEDKAIRSRPALVSVDHKITAEIRADDPSFDPEAFLERSRVIAGKVQDAWSGGDMTPVRNFVSQGVYNRFRLQLRMMREQEKLVNIVGDFRVIALSMSGSSLSHAYQTIHVGMGAYARDITVPISFTEEQNKRILKKTKETAFSEVYSFTRRRGAKTDASKNLLAGQCPSCGAVPDAVTESNKCRSCGTIYNSGEFDWVLSEITQSEEWKPGSAADVPGLSELEKENLSINRGIIEDRASFLFWRWIAARAGGSAAVLARDATAKFLGGFAPPANYFAQTAVGAVDLLEITGSDGEARAAVLVLWSSCFASGTEPEHRENILRLVLPLRIKNPYGFADHSCDSCGGPLPESDAQKCTYCGGALQKTNSDWLLDSIEEKK